MGNTSSKGAFSIAKLVYQRVNDFLHTKIWETCWETYPWKSKTILKDNPPKLLIINHYQNNVFFPKDWSNYNDLTRPGPPKGGLVK